MRKRSALVPPVVAQATGANWSCFNGDCIEILPGMPDESVHYVLFSPAFASLYVYSNSERDMGNCRSYEEFCEHYRLFAKELYRVLKPGRLLSFHCMLLPASKQFDGFIGLKDFRGDLIRLHRESGLIYHSEVVIWKDPVTAMQRTKALGLLHKQIVKDSAMSRQGIPDYLITMRKPGVNAEPVSGQLEYYAGDQSDEDFTRWCQRQYNERPGVVNGKSMTFDTFKSVQIWQRYASPVWMDINPSNTLQRTSAREEKDERHICLAAGSLVLTREHGYVAIEDVEAGDSVLTHKGRWMPVTAKRCNGSAEIIRVCAQGVADLRVTPSHELWTKKARSWDAKAGAVDAEPRWMEAQSTIASYLNLKLPPVEENPLTADEWWIVGRWLGDGHRGGHDRSGARGGFGQQILISCAHDEVDELRGRLGAHAGHTAVRTATQIALVKLRDEVREVINRCGHGAKHKKLPGEAIALCEEKSEALLAGYLSADGHYVAKHDRHIASSVSRALLLGMAIVAQRCRHAVASVYAGRPERLGVIEGREVSMAQDWILAFRNSDGYRKSGWIAADGAWKKVRKIQTAGFEIVWDLQVAEDASFTAEGAVVHNCPLQLQVIQRALQLWTMPGDVVLSPCAGIGSEGYVAVGMDRKAVLIELKESYWKQACLNLRRAETEEKKQSELFSYITEPELVEAEA